MKNKNKIIAILAFIFVSLITFNFTNPIKVNATPVITVDPTLVKIIVGTNYDVTTGVVTTDDVDTFIITSDITDTTILAVGSHIVTYTATDAIGNISTATRTINILSKTADEDHDKYTNGEELLAGTNFDDASSYPSYSPYPTITLDVNNVYKMQVGSSIPVFNATAFDVADGDIPVTIEKSINRTKIGTYSVTFSARDSLGNISIKAISVYVVLPTPPVINLIGETTIKTVLGYTTYTDEGANVTDNLDATRIISGVLNGDQTVVGQYTLVYDATDVNANVAITKVRTIKVLNPLADEDGDGYSNVEEIIAFTDWNDVNSRPPYGKAPIITEYNPSTMEVKGTIPDFQAIATDVGDGDIPVVITHTINPNVIGTYLITFTATDLVGNVTTLIKQFNVIDSTAPVITLNGSNPIYIVLGFQTYSEQGAIVSDNYDPNFFISSTLDGDPNVVGTYNRVYNANDSRGNHALEVIRTVHVLAPLADEDGDGYNNREEVQHGTKVDDASSHPDYNPGPNISENNTYIIEVGGIIPTFSATTTDEGDMGTILVTITNDINPNMAGIYKVTFTATDSLGNVTKLVKDFYVVSTTYQVTHRYENVDGITYTDVVESFQGSLGDVVDAGFKFKTGFAIDYNKSITSGTIGSVPYLELIMYYGRNIYKVTYQVPGLEDMVYSYKFEENIIMMPDLYKTGYTFSGWNKTLTVMGTSDEVVSGEFTVNTHNIIYYVDGAVYETVTNVAYDTSLTAIAVPTKVGYTFSGWSTIPSKMPDNDLGISGVFIQNVTKLIKIVACLNDYIYGRGDSMGILTVRAYYANGTSHIITNYTYSGFSTNNIGLKILTVSYKEGTITKTDILLYIVLPECYSYKKREYNCFDRNNKDYDCNLKLLDNKYCH